MYIIKIKIITIKYLFKKFKYFLSKKSNEIDNKQLFFLIIFK
jgi:hypothetical protein